MFILFILYVNILYVVYFYNSMKQVISEKKIKLQLMYLNLKGGHLAK